MSRKPMTATEARDNVAAMMRDTPANARKRLLQVAPGPLGNLSEGARAVYQEALSAALIASEDELSANLAMVRRSQ